MADTTTDLHAWDNKLGGGWRTLCGETGVMSLDTIESFVAFKYPESMHLCAECLALARHIAHPC